MGIFYIIFAVVNTFSAEAFLKFGENFVKFIPSLNAHISVNFDFYMSRDIPKRLSFNVEFRNAIKMSEKFYILIY